MTSSGAHGVRRSIKALLACGAIIALATLATLAAAVEPAHACSCIQPNPWKLLKEADGAFVGRLVGREDIGAGRLRLRFDVERAVKGSIGSSIDVVTPNNGAACGIELPVGSRTGLFLARDGGLWTGTLCWQVSAEELLAAAALPAPNGRWPAAMFVGGRFGPARTIALDSKGHTLGYAVGSGDVLQVDACPGGRRVVELVYRGSDHFVAVRELPMLWLVREQRLPRREETGVFWLRCMDARGEKIAVFTSGPHARGLLTRITPSRVTTLWRGSAFYASFWRNVAFVQAFSRRGTKIVSVDLRLGTAKLLGSVRATGLYDLAPNAAGTKLVGDSFEEGCRKAPCAHLVVIDLQPRPNARRIPLPTECCGSAGWIPGDRFAYFSGGPVLIYTASLRRVGRISGWTAGRGVVLGRRVYGVTPREALIHADLSSGQVRVVRGLPGDVEFISSAAR